MKKVMFIVLVSGFMMPSYHVHASDGDEFAMHAAAQAKELGQRLIEIIQRSKRTDNIEEQVRQLLADGADVNAQNKSGWTALMFAAINGRTGIVQILLERYADVNLQNRDGYTALMYAAEFGSANVVEILLDRGANVNMQDKEGYTALMLAAQNGHTNIVEILLSRGANVDAQASSGWTALMFAAQNGHTNMVEFLLDRGADPMIKNTSNQTALDLCPADRQDIKDMLNNKRIEIQMQAFRNSDRGSVLDQGVTDMIGSYL